MQIFNLGNEQTRLSGGIAIPKGSQIMRMINGTLAAAFAASLLLTSPLQSLETMDRLDRVDESSRSSTTQNSRSTRDKRNVGRSFIRSGSHRNTRSNFRSKTTGDENCDTISGTLRLETGRKNFADILQSGTIEYRGTCYKDVSCKSTETAELAYEGDEVWCERSAEIQCLETWESVALTQGVVFLQPNGLYSSSNGDVSEKCFRQISCYQPDENTLVNTGNKYWCEPK